MTWKFQFLWSILFWLAESVPCISCTFWLVERCIRVRWQALMHCIFGWEKKDTLLGAEQNRYIIQFYTILSTALTHNTVNFYSGFLNEKHECKISEIIDNLLLQRSWSSSILQWTEMLLLHLKNFFRVLRKVK